MKITVVCGSQRTNSESLKVSQYFCSRLLGLSVESEVIDLVTLDLPFAKSPANSEVSFIDRWSAISEILRSSDGYIFVSPEWGGMATPILKNFFLLANKSELNHKPALLVGVSNSRGGAYVISDLRASSYKNSRICYIPEQIIVRDCVSMLNDQDMNNETDKYLKHRIEYSISVLIEYSRSLTTIRDGGVIDNVTYPNGM
jgi:multimeric flavodoxin WrbA